MQLNRPNYDLTTLWGDLSGALTSTVVSLPFALAFGVASGLGAAAGLYGSIAVGFFAAVFGGSRAVISGPSPSVTIAMAIIVSSHAASLPEAFTIVALAGLLQILLGISGLGRFVAYTPYLVIAGLMSGIGVIILIAQIAPMLGGTSGGSVVTMFLDLPLIVADIESHALFVGIATLACVVFWPTKFGKILPPPLVALVVGSVLGVLWLTHAPTIGVIPSGLPDFHFNIPDLSFVLSAVQPALVIALLSSIDSLLAGMASDSLTGTRHNASRELVGQGLGNFVAGLVGGLPGAGASVSTVTNIRAGGRTRVSGVLRAIFLLVLVVGIGHVVESIPLAVLSAILLRVGWSLIDWNLIRHLVFLERHHVVIFIVTVVLTIFVDLIVAAVVGLIFAGMAHTRQLERFELDSVNSIPLRDRSFFADEPAMASIDAYSARVRLVALKGRFTVASSKRLSDVIVRDIEDHEIVIFDFSETTYLDDSASMLIGDLLETAKDQKTASILACLPESIAHTLFSFGVLRKVPANHIVESMDDARAIALGLMINRETI